MTTAPRNYFAKEWDRAFSRDRIPEEAVFYVESKRRIDAKAEGIAIFLCDADGAIPSRKFKVVEEFCRDACLDDIKRGLKDAGQLRAAWIDDRSFPDESNEPDEPSGGQVRKCMNPLTATALYRHMKQPRFNNRGLPDADRRLIHIPNLDPNYIMALAETATHRQVSTLRDAIRNHLAFETSIRVKLPGLKGPPMFQMEIHIPFFAYKECPPPAMRSPPDTAGCGRSPKRPWIDLSFLSMPTSMPTPKAKDEPQHGICKSRFSLVICGSGDRHWVGYAFVDEHIDEDGMDEDDMNEEGFSYGGFQEDPITGLDANQPIRDPREYFLIALETHMGKVLDEWENLMSTIERRINDYKSCHPAYVSRDHGVQEECPTENGDEALKWILRTKTLLGHLLDVLSKTVKTWERFKDNNDGDIGYFYDSASADSSKSKFMFSEQRARRSLQATRETFETLKEKQEILLSLKDFCDNSAKDLQFIESSKASQHTGITIDFTLLVLYPFALTTSFFPIPQLAPFTLNFKFFVICFFILMAMIKLLFIAVNRIRRGSLLRKTILVAAKSLQHQLFSKKRDNPPPVLNNRDNLPSRRNRRLAIDTLEGATIPEYTKLWENAANGFDYGTIDALVKDISMADNRITFDPIVLQYELPAVLNSSDRTRAIDGEAQRPDAKEHVVLVNDESSTQSMEEPVKRTRATTCAEYITEHWETKWSDFVLELLDLIQLADLNSAHAGFSVCAVSAINATQKPQISVTCDYSSISISFSKEGLMEAVGLIEALDWLCKAMRIPKIASFSLSTAAYHLERRVMPGANEDSPSSGLASQREILRPSTSLRTSPLPESEHNCWQLLFSSCIVADSTSLRDHDFGKGLEASFDLMISLAAAEFSLVIDRGVVFIGYQTLLFPTAIQDNCAQFHLITSKDGQINPYTLDLGERVLTSDPRQFKKMRCFLGWCEAAQINLGTKQLPASVKYSGGRDHGKSLRLDGYSILGQAGASAPLSAVLGLQTNFKYTSHRLQFTPLGNYCKLLQDTSRDLAIIYDAAQRRCWLVPKLSLLLHMSHVYTLGVGASDDRVPYVEAHADAVEVITALEPWGDTLVCGRQRDGFLFRELMLGLNINLLSTVASLKKSGSKTLYGFEFMDVITEPGRGTCMKSLDILSLGKNWLDIVNAVDAVVVCSDLGEAITAVGGSGRERPECNVLPKNLDYLAATLPCLARLAERKGEEMKLSVKCRPINIAENIFWKFSGDPFRACQHNTASIDTCWKRTDLVQRLRTKNWFGLPMSLSAPEASTVLNVPTSGAVVFGKSDL